MYTFNYNANIRSTISYRLLLVASISDIGTCQKPTLVHLYQRAAISALGKTSLAYVAMTDADDSDKNT